MIKTKQFIPGEFKYQCQTCKQIIWSRYEGEYRSCMCGNAVDQTAYYTRLIGETKNLKKYNDCKL